MSLTLTELTDQINAHPAPLLFLDTCTILDLIRVPYREELPPNMIEAAKRLLSKTTSQPPQLWTVISDLVEMEWESNVLTTSKELKKQIRLCDRFLEIIQQIFPEMYPVNLTRFDLETHLTVLSKQVVNASLKIARDNDCVIKASERVVQCQAPASRGKQEMKDCMIIEHYLEVCQRLRNTGFSQPVIFVSSNVNDYGKPPTNIQRPLDTQFSNLGIQFVTQLNWAMSLI